MDIPRVENFTKPSSPMVALSWRIILANELDVTFIFAYTYQGYKLFERFVTGTSCYLKAYN